LDDFTEYNGATRVIPGTHRSGKIPSETLKDVKAPHPDQVLTIAPAGTVVVFNSHLWHGGTLNRTQNTRCALHSYFCRRYQPQQTNQSRYLSPKTISRLTDVEKFILDIQSA
jgi:ectoine hydroxylase-related dioxygenase (phytanoyl-CoA dioxygenase family)